jgi:hypothetical protein
MFKGLLDIGTHMSIVQLQNGRFVAIDTIQLTPAIKQEIDALTQNGTQFDAVIATHPYHTVFFRPFYNAYPNTRYYGTPRHLRTISEIPWAGNVNDEYTRKQWEPDLEMRIPAGSEFVNPLPPDTNHFSNVFVYHRKSRSIHNDDTILYSSHPGFLISLAGFKDGSMSFHPSIKSVGLFPTPDAPRQFREWVLGIIRDWDFDNILSAHNGNKIGGAKQQLMETLQKAEKLLNKLSEKNRTKEEAAHKTPNSSSSQGNEPPQHSDCG